MFKLIVVAGLIGTLGFLLIAGVSDGSSIGGFPSGPLGGESLIHTQEELQILRKKEDILERNFAVLKEESETVDRERAAVERALAHLRLSEDSEAPENRQHRIELTQKLTKLSTVERDIRRARATLTQISSDRERYEEYIVESYRELAQMAALIERTEQPPSAPVSYTLMWPVEHDGEGISAGFRDPSYAARFGFAHEAIDIPVDQGTTVYAPKAGPVLSVHDRGYGYNTLAIEHADGLVTIYGHVTEFLVQEGNHVRTGDAIALSGGRPGTKGSGPFTTGPHLHFETRVYGEAVDPLFYLPKT